ncbi:MAG: SCO family protein [Gammaproteobacteria bacterium]|nr:SCO family protein [Gammaproteobacteria bacterium]
MTASPTTKTAVLFFATLAVISVSFALAVWHHDDPDARVEFRLTSHTGDTLTARDLGGRHLMVFFGFTSCHNICPAQMNKLTRVMSELDQSGHGTRIKPVFISVDPERDTPAKVAAYLEYFDDRFVGLTGSRTALERAAASFRTLFEDLPAELTADHQINHSTVVYIVDPFSRIVDYLPGSADHRQMAARIRRLSP